MKTTLVGMPPEIQAQLVAPAEASDCSWTIWSMMRGDPAGGLTWVTNGRAVSAKLEPAGHWTKNGAARVKTETGSRAASKAWGTGISWPSSRTKVECLASIRENRGGSRQDVRVGDELCGARVRGDSDRLQDDGGRHHRLDGVAGELILAGLHRGGACAGKEALQERGVFEFRLSTEIRLSICCWLRPAAWNAPAPS